MLNVDTTILSKVSSNKLNFFLPTLISSQRTSHVKNKFIKESGSLISDIIQISDWFNIERFLVTMNNKKSGILGIKNDRSKIVKILIFPSLSREHFQSENIHFENVLGKENEILLF